MTSHGCPICGFDYTDWTLLAQEAHVYEHSYWQLLKLRYRTRTPLRDLLINRNYRIAPWAG